MLLTREGISPHPVQGPNPLDLPADREVQGVRAWHLETLFGTKLQFPGAILEATLAHGDVVALRAPGSPRDGGRMVLWTDPEGRWGLATVGGDDALMPLPRANGTHAVTGLQLRVPREGRGTRGLEPQRLSVRIGGKEQPQLTAAALAAVPSFQAAGARGGGRKHKAWSLRAVAEHLAGPGARVTHLTTVEGSSAALADRWADASLTPVLRLNRRGAWKFHWADAAMEAVRDSAVHDVTGLDIQGP